MRRRPRQEPDPKVYQLKVECLQEFEALAQQGLIDLYYGDESRVCLEPCALYGWQFADEEVFMPSSKGPALNCFALLTRDNRCVFETTPSYVDALWVAAQLEKVSWQTWAWGRISVVVLDNAPVHTGVEVQKRRADWEARGLFVFFCRRIRLTSTSWKLCGANLNTNGLPREIMVILKTSFAKCVWRWLRWEPTFSSALHPLHWV